ncbi:hypothetical protein CHH78_02515 [Shouchella clausii]|uniref:AAA family ATPase n=1 Tax=Shouchella clausii TaxID=79880 RepID=UPI000BA5C07E|nr:ATP-binding protein [Shouchella clausii]PAD10208.1 hypothetical protein CHH76_05705 [Shouchella clausii]PAE86190.1 hypothetical protein CHH78_02515 [Shouchella clausii]PAF06872.1 hypothetical protein CHH66_02510 [Shouchella clausii]
MKAELVLKLIKYHYEKNENAFADTVLEITELEEKKGNKSLAGKFKNAMSDKEVRKKIIDDYNFETQKNTLQPSSGLTLFEKKSIYVPKDKSSNLTLFELFEPTDIERKRLKFTSKVEKKIQEIKNEFSNKKKLIDLNLPFDNKLLLCGPPGCGKTSLAFLIAKELNYPLAYVRLDSMVSSLLGHTGQNIRKVFDEVNNKKVVLFLDEFDAIAKKRDDTKELGELKRVVNTLLQNIDSLSSDVFLIAATNHHHLLDKAVWRRFNSVIYLDLPNDEAKRIYIEERLSDFPSLKISKNLDLKKVVGLTRGFNFSDLNEIIDKTVKNKLLYANITDEELKTRDFVTTVSDKILMYNASESSFNAEKLKYLRDIGFSVSNLTEITGLSKTTIYDRLNGR